MRFLFIILIIFSNWTYGQELHKYSSIVNQVDTKKWLNDYQRTVDSDGILIQKKQYHALSIAFYGIMAYNDYQLTGDTSCLRIISDQFKYFNDTSRVDYIDNNKGMRLPYHFKFHDLKAPWYSGMTQGVAISYLARYYLITEDKRALKMMRQLAYFMCKDVKEGGTIGKTPEGFTFIEEYPNSKSHPNVFNGFVNGLVGLNEYLEFFPKDTMVRRIHDECYNAVITTINKYDTPKWSKYDRKGGKITNHYMRYEISELEQLYKIYEDPAIFRQMMLWSYFAFGKIDTKMKHYKFPKYQFNVPLSETDERVNNEKIDFSTIYVTTSDFQLLNKKKKATKKIVKKKSNYILLPNSYYHAKLDFNKQIDKDQIKIKLDGKTFKLDSLNSEIDSNFITINATTKFNEVNYSFKSKNKKSMLLDSVFIFNQDQYLIPKFGFTKMKNHFWMTSGESYKVFEGGDFTNDALVFYRFAGTDKAVDKALHNKDQFFPLNSEVFTPQKSAFYEFIIVTPQIKGFWCNLPSFAELVKD